MMATALTLLIGAMIALTGIAIYQARLIDRFRKKPCTACGRASVQRLVETLDFHTGETHRGVLCTRCALYADQIEPPTWAK